MPGIFENQFILAETEHLGLPKSQLSHPLPVSYSQCGEDLIVEGLIKAHLFRGGRGWESVFYVEIGANHPISSSNTYLFYKRHHARGVLVEPNPDLHPLIRAVRPHDILVPAAALPQSQSTVRLYVGNTHELSSVSAEHVNSFGTFGGGIRDQLDVPAISINDLLIQYAGGRFIDFLSIDCEGIDYELAKAVDYEQFKPLVIQCEPSEHIFPGNRARIINLMESRSYRLVAMTRVNLIFLRS